jgi:hypothetical protein
MQFCLDPRWSSARMSRVAGRLAPGLALALATCTLRGESDALAAARADSSAAGYAVGASTAPAVRAPRDSSARASAGPAAGGAPPSSGTARLRAPAPSARPGGTSGQIDEFFSYDAAERVAELRLVAGLDGSNGSLNFNGAARGARAVIIPLGWRVRLAAENDDGDLSHSVVVIDDISSIPVELPMPAFAGAATADAAEGLAMGESETLSFVASRAGRYLIACGVPGHGQGGQWMRLTISPTATYPTYSP